MCQTDVGLGWPDGRGRVDARLKNLVTGRMCCTYLVVADRATFACTVQQLLQVLVSVAAGQRRRRHRGGRHARPGRRFWERGRGKRVFPSVAAAVRGRRRRRFRLVAATVVVVVVVLAPY